LGRHGDAIADLRSALNRSPTSERRCELLAVALYRAGNQADALAVIATTRRSLRDDLGLQLSPALQSLEQQILHHDPRLDLVASSDQRIHDIDAQLRAAITLVRAGAFEEAETILDEAEAVATESSDQRAQATVLLARAQARMMEGGSDPHELIDRARAIARQRRDGPLLAKAALVRFGAGTPDDKTAALIELTEPIDLLPPTAPEQVDLLCAAAVIVTFIDASGAAEQLVEVAERVDRRVRSTRSQAVLRVAQALVGAVRGEPVARIRTLADEAYALALDSEDPATIVSAIQGVLRACYAAGDIDGAQAVLEMLDRSARDALLPFGVVRVLLSQTMNHIARGELRCAVDALDIAEREGARLRTHAAAQASRVQRLLYDREQEALAPYLPVVQAVVAAHPAPSTWNAIAALAGDDEMAAGLLALADRVPHDDSFNSFVALAADVAAEHDDDDLARWCLPHLRALDDATVMVGLGTAVLGFGRHFAGVAHAASGDTGSAITELRAAIRLATRSGTALWLAHSEIELAGVLARSDDTARAEARQLVAAVRCHPVTAESPRLQRRCDEVDGELVRSSAPRSSAVG
jgi:tetratricopeptide (TPR) repeat protein